MDHDDILPIPQKEHPYLIEEHGVVEFLFDLALGPFLLAPLATGHGGLHLLLLRLLLDFGRHDY